MATNYDIDYNDSRFKDVEADKKAALNEVDVTYGNMISQSDKYYEDQIKASQNWADKQSQLQQEKTDFAIEKIEQQKDQAKKDYTKEQSGAYVDWQKQSNQYGANAEQMASAGLAGSGFSESSQVSMYNTYQNRVTAARESYNQAVLNFNNSINEARLQNNSILAEIAYEALQKQLELSLQGFQYKNTLILDKANKKTQLESEYYGRYQDVLKQINTENALAEEVRQYNEKMAFQKAQFEEEKRQFDRLHPVITGGGSSGGSGGGSGSSGGKGSSSSSNKGSGSSTSIKKPTSNGSSGSSSTNKSDSGSTMNSIIALGYGPISAEKLNQLVAEGKVEEYKENGVTKFRKATKAKAGSRLRSGGVSGRF